MKRWLHVHRIVGSDAALVAQRLGGLHGLLRRVTDSTGVPEPDATGCVLRIPGASFAPGLAPTLRFHAGPARDREGRRLVPIGWRAYPADALLPAFEGTLELEALDAHRSQLTIVGAAIPPPAQSGEALDSPQCHAIAERTASCLLAALCTALESESPRGAARPRPARIRLRVADVMTPEPTVVGEATPIRTAAFLLHQGQVSGLPVVDRTGRAVGVISEADLLPHLAPKRLALGRGAAHERQRREAATVGSACSRPARTIVADAMVADAAREMLDHDVSRLVVRDGDRIVGIVSRHDVLRALVRSDDELTHAAQAVLREAGVDIGMLDVHSTSGTVRVCGEVPLRSLAQQLPHALEVIDGVEEVDTAELRWATDDLAPGAPLPLT